jgi:phage terminase small subunit
VPHGEPTPEHLVAEFRAHYLLSGNAAKSAKKVGIPVRTGQDIANRLLVDPQFTRDRADMRASYLDELVFLRQQVARTAAKRARAPKADEYHLGPVGTVVDKRPEWAKVLLDAEKNAHALAKVEKEPEQAGSSGPAVVIHLSGEAEVITSEPSN